jgi:hypothetical protein
MKLAKFLFKPKWQDKDANVRGAAVAADTDAELLAALPEIARRDEDAGVRLAALRRLDNYEAWRERATGDADPAVRAAAREAYLDRLCAGAGDAPPVARRVAELETLNEQEIERVAANATEPALRRDALGRVGRQSLLAQRAVADTDAAIRLHLLERVSDVTLLERIAERTRKSDKAVCRRARERLQAAGIASGDAAVIAQRARLLCERVEVLMRAPAADTPAQLQDAEQQWQALGGSVPSELIARFQGARQLALQALQPREVRPPATEPHAEPVTPQPVVVVPPIREGDAGETEQVRAERSRRKAARDRLHRTLDEFAAAVESGDSSAAHRLHAQLEGAELPADLQSALDHLQPRYAELKRWQHWSNNQRRRTLCVNIESLIDSGLHPDAVATRVREARTEWQRLDAAENIGGDAGGGLAQRFHAVCHRAMRPTQAYFAKRKEVKRTHAQQINELLARTAAIADDATDWKEIAELRAQASSALRALDGVDANLRQGLAKQLKEALARMAKLSGAHERDVEAAKARLIAQAVALSGSDAEVAREARELQKRWTAVGNGRRATDQQQWREFRAACDAVFARLETARKGKAEADAQATAQARQILEEFAALADDAAADADEVKKKLRDLDSRWAGLSVADRALARRQRELHESIQQRLKSAGRRKRLKHLIDALRKYAALRAAETGGALPSWEELPACPEFDDALARRLADAQGGPTLRDEPAARTILVQLEFLAGVESAPEDRQLRMTHQVQRLSSRLREGSGAAPDRELSDLLLAWFGQAPQTPAIEDRFAAAAHAAIDSLP